MNWNQYRSPPVLTKGLRIQLHDMDLNEIKIGGEQLFDDSVLSKVSFGASYSDRSKERQLFDNFSATQGEGIFCAFCNYTVDFDDDILREVNLGSFLDGVSGADRIPRNFLTASFEDAFAALNSTAAINDPARLPRPISSEELIQRRDAAGDSIFGFFEPDLNTAGSFRVDEEIASIYVNTFWQGDIGIPWSANLGFRYDRTDTTSFGVDQPVIEFRESAGDTQLAPVFGDATEISVSNDYTNFLPSANLKLDLTDSQVLRFAYSETVTRPTLTSLGVNNEFGGRSDAPTSTGGNPNLEAFEASNFDVSYEWYADELTFVGASVFYKDLENFLEAATLPVQGEIVIPPGNTGNPGTEDITVPVTFQDTRTRNGEEGSIQGVELAAQVALLSGLGGSVNYTYVDSDIDRAEDSGASDCDFNGLSPHTVNASGFFENDRWSARLSYNFRDEFLVQCFSDQSEPRERESFGQFDLSVSYEINNSYQVFLEGVNIFDEDRRDFSRFRNRFLTLEDTGPRYTIGIRGSF